MGKTKQSEFEVRWEKACNQPEVVRHVSDNPIVVDLSLDHVLDRYLAAAHEHVRANRISQGAFDALREQTHHYQSALRSLDDGGVLNSLRDFRRRLNPFRR